jgi:tetratricopeptide (TPR) repeat protein
VRGSFWTVSRLLLNLLILPLSMLAMAILTGHGVTLGSLGSVLLFPALALTSIACHEAGHALAARLLGLSVPRVELGAGRRVASWRWGATRVTVHAFPTLGLTYFGAASEQGLRGRVWLGVAAGPIVTALLAAAAMRWPTPFDWSEVLWPVLPLSRGWALRELFAFLNLWLLALNLLPLAYLLRSMGMRNDGTLLVSLLREPAARLREFLSSPTVLEAQERSENNDHAGALRLLEAALQKDPSGVSLRNSLAVTQLSLGQFGDARTTFLQLMQELDPARIEHWVMRNNLAWTNFRLRSDELLAEADAHSAAVFERFDNAPWALGTRGSVLVWKGEVEQAVSLLERAYLMNSSPSNRALNACGLAVAHARRNDVAEARRWMQRADENDAHCPLLAEARAALTEATARAA